MELYITSGKGLWGKGLKENSEIEYVTARDSSSCMSS